MKAKADRIFIEVMGGNVVGVYATRKTNTEIVVVDWDNIKEEPSLNVDEVEELFQPIRDACIELPIKGVMDVLGAGTAKAKPDGE